MRRSSIQQVNQHTTPKREEESAKNETRRELLDNLGELDPKYKFHMSEIIDGSLFKISNEIEMTKKMAIKKSRARRNREDQETAKERAENDDTLDDFHL
ncbi:hypothetical protein BpHYR1_017486 [Brachionus plicatilis]|uniref:Uncharacterized protein n=1 Tax=Brachionus plicatilis TaxID=10195 RepID=A0A3M7QQ14_BRAPC|nr:hypothetical protein BpHYR1_017486 [Brachionus plicatilis]